MSQIKVSYKRHLAKTISYRIISTTIGFLAMWWASGSVKVGAAFGVVELIYKPLQYYIHERIWYRHIRFGLVEEKKKPKPKVTSSEIEISNVPSGNVKGKKVLNYSSNR
jgi:uncharacterized membrane protein